MPSSPLDLVREETEQQPFYLSPWPFLEPPPLPPDDETE